MKAIKGIQVDVYPDRSATGWNFLVQREAPTPEGEPHLSMSGHAVERAHALAMAERMAKVLRLELRGFGVKL
jgi:hypothetical protein